MSTDYTYIDRDQDLEDVIEQMRQADMVTVDTEFTRTDTYFPEVGLIQLFDGDGCFLVDPLGVESLGPVADLLADETVLKVLHACSEDLEVFDYGVGETPRPVFDTQIAAAVLGTGFSMSYQKIVEHYLSITVPKEQTRSDWSRRPLSDAQLDYAALDVIYLYQVYERQADELAARGRRAWVDEDCASLGREIAINVNPEDSWLRFRGAARMEPRELNRLRALCAWRERRARDGNLPRNRVVDEKTISALVRKVPYSREGLGHCGMSPRQIRKFGDDLIDVLDEAEQRPESEWPAPLPEASGNVSNSQLKALKGVVAERAEALDIAPEMLARRRQLEEILRGDEPSLPDSLRGWRREVIGEPLLEKAREVS